LEQWGLGHEMNIFFGIGKPNKIIRTLCEDAQIVFNLKADLVKRKIKINNLLASLKILTNSKGYFESRILLS
jgi:hypothetical protein